MDSTQQIQEPILVKNPLTGRFVNVAPLFNSMRDMDGDDNPASLKNALSRAIRHLNLCSTGYQGENETDRLNVNYDLYRLEDMFAAMTEFKQG